MKIQSLITMRNIYACLISFFILFFAINTQAQETARPKIGLCLSGGGAKGMAHIALLKAIDSLGIKVDYITGTSMGSIIGGLYAIGYSGKQLDSIVRKINWEEVLSNNVSLRKINFDEKEEYARYALELPFTKGNFRLPYGFIESQALINLLQRTTFRALPIEDFNKFPIPFKCVAADVITGEAFVLDKGNLAMAMRTSMAIPTVFSPIEKGEFLFVDGGLVKNFPVDKVQEMGANFIIGSYTGGTLYDKHRLNNFIKILYQTSSYNRINDSEIQKKRCNILIDFDDPLRKMNAGVGDFKKTKAILRASDSAVVSILPALTELKQKISDSKASEIRNPKSEIDSVNVAAIEVLEYYSENDSSFLIDRESFDANHYVKLPEVTQRLDYLYGTRHYTRVIYAIETENGLPILKYYVTPAPRISLKFGLHYDSELGTGVATNLTLRNMFGRNSRASVSVDISDKPKFRFDFRKHLGSSRFWWNAQSYFEAVSADVFVAGKTLDNYGQQNFNNNLSFNFSPTAKTNLSLGMFYENVRFKPNVLVTDRSFLTTGPEDTVSQIALYKYAVAGLQLKFEKNSLDSRFFPHHGSTFNFTVRMPFYTARTSDTTFAQNGNLLASKTSYIQLNRTYISMRMDWQKVLPVTPDAQIIFNAAAGFYSDVFDTEIGFEPAARFALGGIESRNSYQYVPFIGNREAFNYYNEFFTVRMSYQMHLFKLFYAIPSASMLLGDATVTNRSSRGLQNTFYSYGVTFGVKTPIGPVQFNIAKADNDTQWHSYFSLGTRF